MDAFTQDSYGFMITSSDILIDCESNFEIFLSIINIKSVILTLSEQTKARDEWNKYIWLRNTPWYKKLWDFTPDEHLSFASVSVFGFDAMLLKSHRA